MSESNRVEAHFSGGAETPELAGYRPISPLVIGACIAALTSPLALVHPMLWGVPILAAILSMWAIVRVSAAHSRYSGRSAAIIALCFATLMGGYAPARTMSHERALYSRARSKAEQWVALMQQGRVQEAHQLTMDVSDRFQGPESLASHYAETPPREPPSFGGEGADEMLLPEQPASNALKVFLENDAAVKLLAYGEHARIEHLQNVMIQHVYSDVQITQRFRASGIHDGQPDSFEFLIRATRQEGQNQASWKVGELEEVK